MVERKMFESKSTIGDINLNQKSQLEQWLVLDLSILYLYVVLYVLYICSMYNTPPLLFPFLLLFVYLIQ